MKSVEILNEIADTIDHFGVNPKHGTRRELEVKLFQIVQQATRSVEE